MNTGPPRLIVSTEAGGRRGAGITVDVGTLAALGHLLFGYAFFLPETIGPSLKFIDRVLRPYPSLNMRHSLTEAGRFSERSAVGAPT